MGTVRPCLAARVWAVGRSRSTSPTLRTGTVSRALNNRAGVNAETRSRVLKAAIEIGYVANQSGRNLRRGATNTIGFVIETGNPANQEGGAFFYIILDEMNLYLAARGYDLVILPCHSADDPAEFLARATVDALVLTATRRQDRRIELLTRSVLPFITLGRSETGGAGAQPDWPVVAGKYLPRPAQGCI